MANKVVPNTIQGLELHPSAKFRTAQLFAKLEAEGFGPFEGVSSNIDRIRVLATHLFRIADARSQGRESAVNGDRQKDSPDIGDDVRDFVRNLR